MPKFAFAVPVLPGQDARAVPAVFQGREEEYRESRARAGITMERVYEMPTPMGTFAIAYLEAEHDYSTTLAMLVNPELPIDRDFAAAIKQVHGFDPAQQADAPPPEVIADWRDPDVSERRNGLCFVAPLIPGRTEQGRAFAAEAFEARRQEFTESRRALGGVGETVCLNQTPMGDIVCVYIEAADPVEANRRFATSQRPFDVWFREQCAGIFPAEVDMSQPLPPITQVWEWQRTGATV